MARNAEPIRQWEILRAIDAAQGGISIGTLAAQREVHPRTIRRDIEALCRAGFPLYDEKINGTPMWRLGGKPFRCLEGTGLGLTELAALYFGHAVLTTAAGTPFENDGERALLKLDRALAPSTRRFVDQLPRMLNAKARGRKKTDPRKLRDIASRALDAIVRERGIAMRYASASSKRTREYAVEPQRLSYADGGMYLTAWVPEYEQLRTFALERIETLAVGDGRAARRPLPAEPFTNSLGAFTGPAERIEIEFTGDAAGYVQSREWHRSQEIDERTDGSIVLRLEVSNDLPLRSWILSFGSQARVLAPAALAGTIGTELSRARERYGHAARFHMAS